MKLFLTLILTGIFLPILKAQSTLKQDTLKARQLIKDLPEEKEAALAQLEQVAKLYQKHELTEWVYRVRFKTFNYKDFDDAKTKINEFEIFVNELDSAVPKRTTLHINVFLNLGDLYIQIGKHAKAVEICQQAEQAYQELSTPSLELLYYIYRTYLFAYYYMQDGERLNDYLKKLEETERKINNPKIRIGFLSLKTSIFVRKPVALDWINEAIKLAERIYGKNASEVTNLLKTKVSNLFLGHNAIEKTIKLRKEILARRVREAGTENHIEVANAYIDIGTAYKDATFRRLTEAQREKVKAGNFEEKAIDYYLKALAIYQNLDMQKGFNAAMINMNIGNMYANRLGMPEKSTPYYHGALMALFPNVSSKDPMELIDIAGNDHLYTNFMFLLRIIKYKIRGLVKAYHDKPNKEAIEEVIFHWFRQMDQLIHNYLKTTTEQGSKAYFEIRTKMLTENMVFLYKDFYHQKPNKAYEKLVYEMLDKNMNALLLGSLQTDEASKLGNVNEEVLAEEKRLKKEIQATKTKLLDAIDNKDSSAIKSLESTLTELREAQANFLVDLGKEAPNYHEMKYQRAYPALNDVQAMLDEESTILQYWVSVHTGSLNLLQITKDSISFKEVLPAARDLPEPQRFVPLFRSFRNALTNVQELKNTPQKLFEEYTRTGYVLYQYLGLDSLIDTDSKHLIIIPHASLNHLPFEALLCSPTPQTNDPNYKELDYLLNHYKVSYASSISLWMRNQQKTPKGYKGVLGYAASYGDAERWANLNRPQKIIDLRKVLVDLPGARQELLGLKENYLGQYYLGEEANETTFKSVDRSAYSVLHLAMHGLLNKEHPFASSLAFTENGDTSQDHFVFAYELTQMPIETDLVVLSACETGYGKFEYGEGVASIARSFMYAGTPSLVMTLWGVNDHSTAQIMNYFYEGLHEGLSKPEALQRAKKRYLKQAKGVAAHPFFWAPFVQTGNTKTINLRGKNYYRNLYLVASGSFVLLLIIGTLRFRKRKKEQAA